MKKNQNVIDRSVQADVNRALSRASQSLSGSSIVKRMTLTATLTTTGAGGFNQQLSSAAVQSSPATEWNSFALRYVDHRVLKVKMSFQPSRVVNTRNAATPLDLGPVGVVIADPSGSAAPATVVAAWALESAKTLSLHKPFKMVVRASQEEHLLFNPTSATIPAANRFAIVLVVAGGDATTVYGTLFYEWWVEFRGSQ